MCSLDWLHGPWILWSGKTLGFLSVFQEPCSKTMLAEYILYSMEYIIDNTYCSGKSGFYYLESYSWITKKPAGFSVIQD